MPSLPPKPLAPLPDGWIGLHSFNTIVLVDKGKALGLLRPQHNPDEINTLWEFHPFDGSPPFTVGPSYRAQYAMEMVMELLCPRGNLC